MSDTINERGGEMSDTINETKTLRDYFAAKALAGYWSKSGHDTSEENCTITARQCYFMADVMLAERAK